jgi:hypothetical protein
MMGTSKRALRSRLLRLIDSVIEKGIAGTLPEACRWILGSSAVFLSKPGKSLHDPSDVESGFARLLQKSFCDVTAEKSVRG